MSRQTHMRILHKKDIVFLILLTLIGIGITIGIYFPKDSDAACLEVRQNGSVILTLPLDTDTEQIITDKNGGTNKFQIKERSVLMLEADCGDHTCINTGRISHTGESIVCLPHRLALQITSSGSPPEDSAPDAIVH